MVEGMIRGRDAEIVGALGLFLVAAVIMMLLFIPGCILGPIAASQLSKDQIDSLKSYNDNADLYFCALIGGPPPAGNIVAVGVPKGAPVDVTFAQDCHVVLKSTPKVGQ